MFRLERPLTNEIFIGLTDRGDALYEVVRYEGGLLLKVEASCNIQGGVLIKERALNEFLTYRLLVFVRCWE